MDKTSKYRRIVRDKIVGLASFINKHSRRPNFHAHAVIDEEHDQYLLVKTGWPNGRRARGTTLYLRIVEGQVWIEEDWTEEGISKHLVESGIPEEDIVLAFQSPDPRVLSEAVN